MARVVHFEIHADEPERAVKFYTNSFNWQIQKWEGPADYWLIKTGEESERGIDGGMVRRQSVIDGEAVIAYVCTIGVNSIDESLSTVQANGGHELLVRHQQWHQRVRGRVLEAGAEAGHDETTDDAPRCERVVDGQEPQRRCRAQLYDTRPQQDHLSIATVGERAHDGSHQQ